ncbi:flagellar basal body L-ring protein [Sulfitobacter sp. M57]|uniref:flagellar basal body L-ring protein FlgH n=1 Tax=unclassified Sulfitobacter TaxID=196795 RepID=UPI0023E17C5C|nr:MULTISPECIES: flagellar basal body L-ring protein FlgH [unclassified Sulfitobacter]MDF3414806.1 flagellar basal body L-ring protein [Sulfitobacter sp. KE5]MDF3422287.1 flagellar basal body L-ring protein [Sulfitobacter sp. KE43]MDF3433352.1 flagellar basal body L-ring protein [Sulfitobacter sp. KE42]MDF3458992.1 flagellar basal body L-ring protein [Sulfitobacter sp. S74]MDF3462891.1 flagellar basal body L-ring protein [Sulfitobacter sp. Ks18]
MNKKSTFRRARLALALPLFVLGACAQLEENRNPQVSNLVLDPANMNEVNRISVPMAPRPVKLPPKRAEAASLWSNSTPSYFTDRRATAVGDLVTVLIEIDDRAQLQNKSGRSRGAKQEVGDPDILNFDLSTGSGKILGLESSSESSGEGSIRRNEAISLRVAALIIEKLPNENFVIAGRQEVKVNSELRELRIAGIIRGADINVNNTVDYDKVAEARISYGGRGQISAVQSPRIGEDVLEVILPY